MLQLSSKHRKWRFLHEQYGSLTDSWVHEGGVRESIPSDDGSRTDFISCLSKDLQHNTSEMPVPIIYSGKWLKYLTHFLTHFTALLHGERWGFQSVWRHSQLHTLHFNQLKPELDCFFGGQNDNCFSKSEVQPPNYLNWEEEVPLPLVTWSCLTPRFIPPSSQHK